MICLLDDVDFGCRNNMAPNGFGLGEVWEFEKLLFKFSTIFNRIPTVEPTSVRPYFAKPLLAEVYFWGFKKIIPKFSKKKTNPNPQKKYITANGIGLVAGGGFETPLPERPPR